MNEPGLSRLAGDVMEALRLLTRLPVPDRPREASVDRPQGPSRDSGTGEQARGGDGSNGGDHVGQADPVETNSPESGEAALSSGRPDRSAPVGRADRTICTEPGDSGASEASVDPRFANSRAGAFWAYPLAGVAVGAIAGLAGWLGLQLGLPPLAAAGLALATQALATGALHEDGLADAADGLWGGNTPERRLEIMRDSGIGAYGALALAIGTALRLSALAVLLPQGIHGVGAVIAAACLSRGLLPGLMATMPLARPDGLARGVGAASAGAAWIAAGIGLALATLGAGLSAIVPALVCVALLASIRAVALRKLGGQTGDVLGAAQQVAETAMLLGLAAHA